MTRNTSKALGRVRSRDSLRSSLRCGACVAVLPGPGLALSVHQATGFPACCPWWTERASGGRRCPDDASTAANVVSEARSESRRPERREGFREHYFRPLSATTNRSIRTCIVQVRRERLALSVHQDSVGYPAETDRLTGAYLNTAFQTELRCHSDYCNCLPVRPHAFVRSHR